MFVAQADDHRPGQRGEIDDSLGMMLPLHPSDTIAQHQAPFGVGIEYLDRLSGHRGQDVAGPDRVAVGHILDQAANADDVRLGLSRGQRLHRANHRAGAAHGVSFR